MEEESKDEPIAIFPNPFREKVKLNFNMNGYKRFRIDIYDSFGIKIKEIQVDQPIIEISKNDLGSGFFSFCIINKLTGEIIWNRKVIAID